MKTDSVIVIFAVLAALGLVTVVAVNIMLTIQEAEAQRGCVRGPAGGLGGLASNASGTRCFNPGPPPTAELTVADEEQTREDEPTVEEQVEEDEDEADDEDDEDDEDGNDE